MTTGVNMPVTPDLARSGYRAFCRHTLMHSPQRTHFFRKSSSFATPGGRRRRLSSSGRRKENAFERNRPEKNPPNNILFDRTGCFSPGPQGAEVFFRLKEKLTLLRRHFTRQSMQRMQDSSRNISSSKAVEQ